MKTFNFYKLLSLLYIAAVTFSCVQDDEFDVPDTSVEEPNLDGTVVGIESVKSSFEQAFAGGDATFRFEETNTFMEGYVISSDEGGNFFEEIIIQDELQNPTVGIKVLVDVNPLFTRYEPGRKIFIELDGLSVGLSNGVLALGVASSDFIEKIPASIEDQVITRSPEVGELVPLPISIADLPPLNDDIDGFGFANRYVILDNVQFSRFDALGENRKTYASEASDVFDGERSLESCDSNRSIVFSTSTFADFKSLLLPQGRGSVAGIITKNFEADAFNIVVNDTETVNLDNGDRCDPEGVNCEDITVSGPTFFEDNFESYSNTSDVEAAGWIIENVSGGSTEFSLDEFSNNNYMLVSGFNSGEEDIDTWLVTPEFSLDATVSDVLNVDIQTSFDNGKVLTVLISTDFTGSIEDATWLELEDINVPFGPSDGFGSFVPAGPANLSCVSGSNVRVAFRYTGADSGPSTRYHVDNVEISGN